MTCEKTKKTLEPARAESDWIYPRPSKVGHQSMGRQSLGHLRSTWIALRERAIKVFGRGWHIIGWHHHEGARFQLAKYGVFQVGTLWSSERVKNIYIVQLV